MGAVLHSIWPSAEDAPVWMNAFAPRALAVRHMAITVSGLINSSHASSRGTLAGSVTTRYQGHLTYSP